MEIIKLKINELKPYKNNAKIHTSEQIEQIKKSIEEFGMNDPIAIWGKENIIVEGHGRLEALKQLGIEDVDCIRLDHLTDEERKAYTLAHNKLTMNTDFDFNLLNLELDGIQNIDMSQFGFEIDIPEFNDYEIVEKDDDYFYFDKDEIKKDIVDNWSVKQTLEEFVKDIIDIPTAKYQFNRLCQGYRDGYNISLLFNPHRLICPTHRNEGIYYGLRDNIKFRENYARFLVDVANKVYPQCEYYKQIGLGMSNYQYVNEFQPYLARDIYKKYCKDGDKILNPCAGWGGRLIGLASCRFKDIEYIETDPSKETFEGLKKIKKFLRLDDNYKQYNLPFEDLDLKKEYFDFVFTSPPYFDTEKYSEDEGQSYIKNKNYDEWRDNFLYKMIDKIVYSMKNGAYCMLNVGNKRYHISDDIREYLKEKYNILTSKDEEYKLDQNENREAIRSAEEDFLIFKKGE